MSVHRAQVVGSLLRPEAVSRAQRRFAAGELSARDLKAVEDAAVDEAVDRQEQVGLDVITDGELRRESFFDHFTSAIDGLSEVPAQASRFYGEDTEVAFTSPRSVTERIRRRRMRSIEEFAYIRARAKVPVKVTLPSPLMLVSLWSPEHSTAAYSEPFELFADGADLVREEAAELARLGCEYIQIDAPEFGVLVDERHRARWARLGIPTDRALSEGVELLNSVATVPGVTFGVHVCRGNYRSMWNAAGGYEAISGEFFRGATNFDEFLLEYDSDRAGSFEPLRDLPEDKVVVLGLLSTKSDRLEDPDEVVRRIEEAAAVHPLERLALSTQCGFASTAEGNDIRPESQWAKLKLVGEIRDRVWD